jgi:hypothetical protein
LTRCQFDVELGPEVAIFVLIIPVRRMIFFVVEVAKR